MLDTYTLVLQLTRVHGAPLNSLLQAAEVAAVSLKLDPSSHTAFFTARQHSLLCRALY